MEMRTEATSRELVLLGRAQGEQGRAQENSRGQRRWRGAEYPKGGSLCLGWRSLWADMALTALGGSGTCSSSNASTANENMQGHGKFSIQSPLLEAGKQEKCKVSLLLSKIPDLSESQVLRSCYSKTP